MVVRTYDMSVLSNMLLCLLRVCGVYYYRSMSGDDYVGVGKVGPARVGQLLLERVRVGFMDGVVCRELDFYADPRYVVVGGRVCVRPLGVVLTVSNSLFVCVVRRGAPGSGSSGDSYVCMSAICWSGDYSRGDSLYVNGLWRVCPSYVSRTLGKGGVMSVEGVDLRGVSVCGSKLSVEVVFSERYPKRVESKPSEHREKVSVRDVKVAGVREYVPDYDSYGYDEHVYDPSSGRPMGSRPVSDYECWGDVDDHE